MRAESLRIALRARTPWEATDLGIALVREYAAPIWRAWACIVLPTAVLLGALCQLLDSFFLATLLLWWLKPVFDRIPLHVLSRAVFGTVPSLQETLRAQTNAADFGALFAQLTWRRFHPMRALFLPVDFLERLTGQPRSHRTNLLARAQGSPSTLLTLVSVNMETMLVVSIVSSVAIFLPMEFFSDAMRDTLEHLFTDPPTWAQWAMYGAYTVALSIIEPIYVGAGFGLYLNRRMELEAWDIDLAFRRLAARLRARAHTGAGALQIAFFWAIFGICGMHCDASFAAQNKPAQADVASAAEAPNRRTLEQELGKHFVPENPKFDAALKQVLAGPELNPKATVSQWQRKVPEPVAKKDSTQKMTGLSGLGNGIGFLLQNAFWIALAIGLALALPYLLRLFGTMETPAKSPRRVEELAAFEADTAETLPTELVLAVTQLWQQGQRRKALALLYRAGVLRLCERLGQPLPTGATESDFLRLARDLLEHDRHRVLFPALVRHWQRIAYASLEPSWAEVEGLLARWQADSTPAPRPNPSATPRLPT